MERIADAAPSPPDVPEVVRLLLRPSAPDIDRGTYPREVMHKLGEAGAFAQLADGPGGVVPEADLVPTIDAIAAVAEECAATAFCCWCHAALVWYLRCTENLQLRDRLLAKVSGGEILGGTALSNPMKNAAGLEDLALEATPAGNGSDWLVSGVVAWVSNIEAGHPFGAVFSVADAAPVMAVVDDSLEGVSLRPNDNFEVMAGTATVAARFRNAAVGPDRVLAPDAADFIHRVRPGFVLIQAGIGLGLIQAAARVMERTRRPPSGGLPGGLLATPSQLRARAKGLRARVVAQARVVARDAGPSPAETFQLRLDLAETAIAGATSAQLMAGAGGLMRGNRAIRLVREAAFYGVLTPSVRHLSHLLASDDASMADDTAGGQHFPFAVAPALATDG